MRISSTRMMKKHSLLMSLLLPFQRQKSLMNLILLSLLLGIMPRILILFETTALKVDDYNKLAPENVCCVVKNLSHNKLNELQPWGFDFIDQCAITRVIDQSPIFQGGWKLWKNFMVEIYI